MKVSGIEQNVDIYYVFSRQIIHAKNAIHAYGCWALLNKCTKLHIVGLLLQLAKIYFVNLISHAYWVSYLSMQFPKYPCNKALNGAKSVYDTKRVHE